MTKPNACITIAACAAHAQRLSSVNQTVTMDVLAPCAFKGDTMDRGILYILTGLAAFWLGVAGLVLLFI
jgi:hypothetical protein